MEEQKENKKIMQQMLGKIDYLSRLVESVKEQKNNGQINTTPAKVNVLFEVKSELKDINN